MVGIIVALMERLCSAERTKKTWEVQYHGHKIMVVNTWFHGAFLFVDGECAAVTDKRTAISNTKGLTTELTLDDGSKATIDVHFQALITVKARITANGKRIGGDY